MKEKILELYRTTDLSKEEIAEIIGTTYPIVEKCIFRNISIEERHGLKKRRYSKSKQSDNNPMFGLFGDKHHGYRGDCLDGKGYVMVLKPYWYTGRVGSKHVFKHSVVMCQHLGLTEIPSGFVIHHIDHNPLNNDISNLIMLTKEAHGKLHALERATTRSKDRRVQANSKRTVMPCGNGDMESMHSFLRDE